MYDSNVKCTITCLYPSNASAAGDAWRRVPRRVHPLGRCDFTDVVSLVASNLFEIPPGLERDAVFRFPPRAHAEEPRKAARVVRVRVLEASGIFVARPAALLEREVCFLLRDGHVGQHLLALAGGSGRSHVRVFRQVVPVFSRGGDVGLDQ